MDQDMSDNRRVKLSQKVKGLSIIYDENEGSVMYNRQKICGIDLKTREFTFENNASAPVQFQELSFNDTIQMALQLGEVHALRSYGASYIFTYDYMHDPLPPALKDKVEVSLDNNFQVDEATIEDRLILRMKDTGAYVRLSFRENGKDIAPKFFILPGSEGFYTARDIPMEKAKEEECGKALRYMTQLPDWYIGQRLKDWAYDVSNAAEAMMKEFMETKCRAPINIDVELDGSTEKLELTPIPYDGLYGAERISDIHSYHISSDCEKLMENISNKGMNLYEYSMQIMDIQENSQRREKEKQELKEYFKEELYPHMLKLYSTFSYPNLPAEIKDKFNVFNDRHKKLYDIFALKPSENECWKQIVQEEGKTNKYILGLQDLIQQGSMYLEHVEKGESPKTAQKYLGFISVENQAKMIQHIYDMLPEETRTELVSQEDLNKIKNFLFEARYKDSQLLKDLSPELTRSGIQISTPGIDEPLRADVNLSFLDENEVYTRSKLKSKTNMNYAQLKESGAKLEIVFSSYFQKDTPPELSVKVIGDQAYYGHVDLAFSEQDEISARIEKYIKENDLGNSLEDYMAKTLIGSDNGDPKISYPYTIEPQDVKAVLSPDHKILGARLEVSDEVLASVLFRSDAADAIYIESMDELIDYDQFVDAVITKDDNGKFNVSVAVTNDEFEKPISVPLTDKEKQIILDHPEVKEKLSQVRSEKDQPTTQKHHSKDKGNHTKGNL